MRIILTILFGALSLTSSAITQKELKANAQEAQRLRADDRYYCGEGEGTSHEEAVEKAKQDLIGSIASVVEGSFVIDMSQINEGQQLSSHSAMEAVVRSYSTGRTRNTRTLILEEEPRHRVLVYMTKASMDSVFAQRKDRAMDYIYGAVLAERKNYIHDALRGYYWALCLIKSMSDPASVKITVDMNGEADPQGILARPMIDWIPSKIDDILRQLKAEVAKVEENNVDLLFTYKDKPVTVDFTFNDGLGYGSPQTARNGVTSISLRSAFTAEDIPLKFEYEYLGRAQTTDEELRQVTKLFKGTPFKDAYVTVKRGKKKEMKQAEQVFTATIEQATQLTNAVADKKVTKPYAETVARVAEAIKAGNYASAQDAFTPEGYAMLDTLMHYGKAEVLAVPDLKCYPMLDKTICRSVPMKFTFQGGKRAFTENINFTFNADGKIESLAFSIDNAMREDIFSDRHREAWGDTICIQLANFIENYQTAFALKRIDFIESIFSDDAVIITGHVAKRTGKKDVEQMKGAIGGQQFVTYTTQNKTQYMERLRKCFKSNEFINLNFSDNIVGRLRKNDDRFGINMKQEYYSSSYGDVGYLFLAVDMREVNQPTIFIRTWQPERDPHYAHPKTKVPEDDPAYGLITLGTFKF